MTSAAKKRDLSHFPTISIRTAPENDLIYDQFGIANADDCALALSNRDNGIQEPLAELDAAPVKLLQDSLRRAIESVIDVTEFNAQIELERQDSANVEAHRRVEFNAIRGAD